MNRLYLILLLPILFGCSTRNGELNKKEEKAIVFEGFQSKSMENYIPHAFKKDIYADFDVENDYSFSVEELQYNTDSDSIRFIEIYETEDIAFIFEELNQYRYLEGLRLVGFKFNNQLLTQLINELSNKEYFKKIVFYGCSFKELPSNIGSLKKLETLSIRQGSLLSLPNELFKLVELRYLDLYNNKKLRVISGNIGNLKKLTYLDLAGTSVEEIPASIGQCNSLINITANACKIKKIPPQLGNCSKLQYLHVPYNQISEVPPELFNASNLYFLDIGDNKIESIPCEITKLKGLNQFHIENLGLKELPDCFYLLPYVNSIYMQGNNIELSTDFAKMPNLNTVMIDKKMESMSNLESIKNLKSDLKFIVINQ